jgi:hypothetical protein
VPTIIKSGCYKNSIRLYNSVTFVFSIIKVVSIGVRARWAKGLRGGDGQGHWLDAAKVCRRVLLAPH